ncbi:NUDIX domain-containing protein [Nonomuraea sp. NPDC049419]|uniref:NUDIX hydrolase n=1 Tax=Nonomuraea sp. NPDC049419 TaxID=3155772 RepID=UPI00341AD9FE
MPLRTQRPTARVILAEPGDRVLMLRLVPPDPWPHVLSWHLPGGGIEPGESAADAAVREAWEETGHVLDPRTLGAPVATNEGPWSHLGRHYYSVHTYFFARVQAATLEPGALEDYEVEELARGHQWWRADDLAASQEPVFPPGLAGILPALLAGDRPAEPVKLGW